MKITHHPDESTLLAFAAGSLPSSLAAVVAAHIAMCPHCAREVRLMEQVGAAMMGKLAPVAMVRGVPQPAMLSAGSGAVAASVEAEFEGDGDMPRPLQQMAGAWIDDIRWKRLGMGVWNVPLRLANAQEGDLRLLKVGAGRAMPEHGHGGTELTLILRGSYRDEFGHYMPGDVADLDEEVEHRPIADAEFGCICLIASERPAKFKGLIGRIVQPLTGF